MKCNLFTHNYQLHCGVPLNRKRSVRFDPIEKFEHINVVSHQTHWIDDNNLNDIAYSTHTNHVSTFRVISQANRLMHDGSHYYHEPWWRRKKTLPTATHPDVETTALMHSNCVELNSIKFDARIVQLYRTYCKGSVEHFNNIKHWMASSSW